MNTPLSDYQQALEKAFNDGILPSIEEFTHFCNSMSAEGALTVPYMIPVQVPKPVKYIDMVRTITTGIPKSLNFDAIFNGDTYTTPLPENQIKGGFIEMGKDFTAQCVNERIEKLVSQTGRKFRLGTALEAMLYKKDENLIPSHFVSLEFFEISKVWFNLAYRPNLGFHLVDFASVWESVYKVFIVEDV